MAFEVPPLPYDYGALAPTIDEQTMRLHHDKHHQAYVDNANAALEGTEWAGKSVEQVLANLDALPEEKRAAVRNNAGGHANHSLFWEIMSPDGGGEPSGSLADAINDTFGGFDELKQQVNDAGVKRFGSGWAWFVWDGTGLAAARDRRLGARVLPHVPEPPPGIPQRLVERRQLGRRPAALRRREVVRDQVPGHGPGTWSRGQLRIVLLCAPA